MSRPRIRWPTGIRLPRRTARFRLTALYGGLFLASGAVLIAVTYALFERATTFTRPRLPNVPHAPSINSLNLQSPLSQALPQLQFVQSQLNQDQKALGNVSQPGGLSVGPLPTPLADVDQQLIRDQHQLVQATNHLAQSVHQLAQAGTLQAAQRSTDSHQLLVNSGIALVIVAVLALLAAWLIAGRMLRPLRTIASTAQRISSTNLHERLALAGPEDELKELGDTLDGLFGRLEAAFAAQRHFVANASHELRTPLTAERTLLQVALDDPATSASAWRSTALEVLASTDEQARLIEALLTLATSESGTNETEPVDLATAVAAALSEVQPEIDQRGIHLETATSPSTLMGDRLLIERLVANLLTNATRHNVDHGEIKVVTAVSDGSAMLTVTNTGPVVPSAEVDRLFQPFQRLDPRRAQYRNGHGLGLSIVRAIVTAHGASLTANPMPDGGLSVNVSFPQTSEPNFVPDKPTSHQKMGRTRPTTSNTSPGDRLLVDPVDF
jgi:signal transduction histidine kinase